jgi:hypothetical protein
MKGLSPQRTGRAIEKMYIFFKLTLAAIRISDQNKACFPDPIAIYSYIPFLTNLQQK